MQAGWVGGVILPPLLILPERIPCLSLNQPYAGLLFGKEPGQVGPKSLETRMWRWPYDSGWLAVYATKTPDVPATIRLRDKIIASVHAKHTNDLHGCILGIVWIEGTRAMVAEDAEAACYPFEGNGRLAWPIAAAHLFLKPDYAHLSRGPQKFVCVPRAVIAAGLWGEKR